MECCWLIVLNAEHDPHQLTPEQLFNFCWQMVHWLTIQQDRHSFWGPILKEKYWTISQYWTNSYELFEYLIITIHLFFTGIDFHVLPIFTYLEQFFKGFLLFFVIFTYFQLYFSKDYLYVVSVQTILHGSQASRSVVIIHCKKETD